MSNIEVGEVISATVTEVASYGVSITSEGVNGFIQIPELSWDSYGLHKRASEILKVGDVIKVKVLSKTQAQFYASLRAVNPDLDPWNERNIPSIGQELQGEVVLVAEYGYLIKLPNFMICLLPLSNVSRKLIVGTIITVRVASIDRLCEKVQVALVGL